MTRAQQWFVLIVLGILDVLFAVTFYLDPSDYTIWSFIVMLFVSVMFVMAMMLS